jgi:hypothetical protein
MDPLGVSLIVAAVALVGVGWFVPPASPVRRFGPGGGFTLQEIVCLVLTVIFVPLGLYVIFFKAGATPFQTQSAAGLLGTCFGYWFKR